MRCGLSQGLVWGKGLESHKAKTGGLELEMEMGFCKTARQRGRDEFCVTGNGRDEDKDGERKEMREMKIKMERYA